MLKLREVEHGFTLITGKEISISGKELIELMRAVFAKGACFRIKVSGRSMFPFIRDSDVVTISGLCNSSLDFGKVVALIDLKVNKLIIHRIIGINSGSYLIKGDNAFNSDGLVPKENILGCVTKIERNGRDIFLGLGRERPIIALFSRIRILYLLLRLWRLLPLPITNAIMSII